MYCYVAGTGKDDWPSEEPATIGEDEARRTKSKINIWLQTGGKKSCNVACVRPTS